MKKLKDLKENECIQVNTFKQANKIFKKAKSGIRINYTTYPQPSYVSFNINGFYWCASNEGKKIFQYSDFIKPNKSTKKIIKELKHEVARLDNEVCDIKKMLPDAVVNVEFEKEIDPKQRLYFGTMYNEVSQPEQEEEIDWSDCGQKFIDQYGGIVLNIGKHDIHTFEGVVVETIPSGARVGTFSTMWYKSHFKPFKGEITLKND